MSRRDEPHGPWRPDVFSSSSLWRDRIANREIGSKSEARPFPSAPVSTPPTAGLYAPTPTGVPARGSTGIGRLTVKTHSRFDPSAPFTINQWQGPYASKAYYTSPEDKFTLGAPHATEYFRTISSDAYNTNRGKYTRPFVSLDIETGHNNEVLSIGAVKGVIDRHTGEVRLIDVRERFYQPTIEYSNSAGVAREVHRLTRANIQSLRNQQAQKGLVYSEFFNETERQRLLDFIGNAAVVGHNIEEFDNPNMGIVEPLQNRSVIDTLIVGQSLGLTGHRTGLEYMFKRFTGRSLKAAGYAHHLSLYDALSTMELFGALYKMQNPHGRDIRFIMNTEDLISYGKYEEVMGTGLIRGGYRSGRGHGGVAGYMTEEDIEDALAKQGMHIEYSGTGKSSTDETWLDVLKESAGEDTARVLNDVLKSAKMMSGMTGAYERLTKVNQEMNKALYQFAAAKEQSTLKWLSKKPDDAIMEYFKGQDLSENQITTQFKKIQAFRKLDLAGKQQAIDRAHRRGRITDADVAELRAKIRDGKITTPEDLADDINEYAKKTQDMNKSYRAVERAHNKGKIDDEQYEDLNTQIRWGLITSYDDLSDTLDDYIQKNKELEHTYQELTTTVGKIKFYDPNQYIASARNHWSGVMGAAQGLVPRSILNPLSHLADAGFNNIYKTMAPYNAVQRIWQSGIGDTIIGAGAIAGGIPGALIGASIKGVLAGGTQLFGNVKQAQMEMRSNEIQNTLHTLQAMTSWISTPFMLLARVAKTLTASFMGLAASTLGVNRIIHKLMKSGLNEMSRLGNPLTELTGVSYPGYAGLEALDRASLLSPGSINSVIESFSTRREGLYTLGQVDIPSIIASSLLGVYDKAYGRTGSAQSDYISMVNGILGGLNNTTDPAKRANMMYLTSLLDNKTGSLVHTARLLDVQDINELANPRNRGMYWRPIGTGEEKAFRWDQYEYGAFQQQWGYTKMRIAHKLWTAVGKDMHNGFNEFVDLLAEENWSGAMTKITDTWKSFRSKLTDIWKSISGTEVSGEWREYFKLYGERIGLALERGLIKGTMGVLDVWNTFCLALVDKTQGLLAYLSTFQFKLGGDPIHGFHLDIQNITDAKLGASTMEQMEYYLRPLSEQLYGKNKLYIPGAKRIKKDLYTRAEMGTLSDLDLSAMGITSIANSREAVDLLMQYIAGASSDFPGHKKEAAARMASRKGVLEFDFAQIYKDLPYKPAMDSFITTTMGALSGEMGRRLEDNTTRSAQNDLKIELWLRDKDGTRKINIGNNMTFLVPGSSPIEKVTAQKSDSIY